VPGRAGTCQGRSPFDAGAAIQATAYGPATRLTKARINLGALVKRVHLNKEYVIVEKEGIPVAGLMDIDEFEDYLELRDPKVREHIRRSHQEYLAGKSRPAEQLSRELHKMVERKARRRQIRAHGAALLSPRQRSLRPLARALTFATSASARTSTHCRSPRSYPPGRRHSCNQTSPLGHSPGSALFSLAHLARPMV
jgi:PHD/YefM family antitoxin component YafN of YafNO toxin-antitoxin module